MDVKHYDDKKGNPTSHEVIVELDFRQGSFTLRGLGGSKEDALQNAVVALNRFLTQSEIEAKTAIADVKDRMKRL